MDRRQFIAAGSLIGATPVLARAGISVPESIPASALFKRIRFDSDGLDLSPVEFATLLQEAVAAATFVPDYYALGGCISDLERKFAQLLGKEAAMFVPTGTLANHLAIRKLAGNDRRVLVQAESHLYCDSGDCAETLSGLNLIALSEGKSALELSEIQHVVERSLSGRVPARVGVISIENPVRRQNHQCLDFAELQRISNYAREQGIRLHLDGARLFSLPQHTGKSVRDYAGLFDTVYVSLWKHFNGATGAILAGTNEFVEGLFHTRRMFGGSLPHAWPSIAIVPRYVDGFEADYAESWKRADHILDRLQGDDRFSITRVPNGTSRVFLSVKGVAPELFMANAATHLISLPQFNPSTGDFGLQVNPSLLRVEPDEVVHRLRSSLGL